MINKESLSALIDGEMSEIESHRLLREFNSDDSLVSSWLMYQQIRTTLNAERAGMDIHRQRQLFDRISKAVLSEDEHHIKSNKAFTRAQFLAGSLSIAACLVVAVFLGFQQSEVSSRTEVAEVILSNEEVLADVNETQSAEMVELDEEKQRRLKAYLNQHDRMSRMNSNQRLVNYSNGREN